LDGEQKTRCWTVKEAGRVVEGQGQACASALPLSHHISHWPASFITWPIGLHCMCMGLDLMKLQSFFFAGGWLSLSMCARLYGSMCVWIWFCGSECLCLTLVGLSLSLWHVCFSLRCSRVYVYVCVCVCVCARLHLSMSCVFVCLCVCTSASVYVMCMCMPLCASLHLSMSCVHVCVSVFVSASVFSCLNYCCERMT
jgi:hypothetical protein